MHFRPGIDRPRDLTCKRGACYKCSQWDVRVVKPSAPTPRTQPPATDGGAAGSEAGRGAAQQETSGLNGEAAAAGLTARLFVASSVKERPHGEGETEEECSICLQGFHVGEAICTTPCKHTFHRACIMKWCRAKPVASMEAPKEIYACPYCRSPLLEQPPPAGAPIAAKARRPSAGMRFFGPPGQRRSGA